jgi:trans-AT polyketide synthase, acyltransferase and oxidoreductase domains
MSNEICVEADSGGHTDRGVAYVLMPAIAALRDAIVRQHAYDAPVCIGAAGGIGTPESAAAAFILGADFVLTGSINQCTVEAGASDAVKDMLQGINVQDTGFAPAGDMFEIGAKVQVLKKGLLFPSRASKLHELYLRYSSIDEIDEKTRLQIQEKYFRRSFAEVWAETQAHYATVSPGTFERAQRDPKQKMALIFRWYFAHATRLAMSGSKEQQADYQVHCGPALGAFNQWVKGSPLESWRMRRCADIGQRLMIGTAKVLGQRLGGFTRSTL